MATVQQAIDQAIAHHRAGRLAEAKRIYKKVLAVAPQYFVARQLLGVVEMQSGHYALAAQLFHEAIAVSPDYADAHFNLGLAYRKLGRTDDAITHYRSATRLVPDWADAHNNLALALHVRGDLDAAVAEYQTVLALTPDDADVHFKLANALTDLGRADDAEAHLRTAVELDARHVGALNNLGLLLRTSGRANEAASAFDAAADAKHNDARAHHNAGLLHLERGEHDAAVRSFDAALAIDAHDPQVLRDKALALRALGEHEQAVTSLMEAVDIDEDFHEARMTLGMLLRQLDRLDEAAAQFAQVAERDARSPHGHYGLGVVAMRLRDFEAAAAHHQRALALDPTYVPAMLGLGNALDKLGRFDEAASCFERADAAQPRDDVKLRLAVMAPAIIESTEQLIDWRAGHRERLDALLRRDLRIDDPNEQIGACPFYLAYQGYNDRQTLSDLAAVHLNATPSLAWTAPHVLRGTARPAGERIHIGVISDFLWDHTIGRLNAGLIRELPRDRFDVTVLRFGAARDAFGASIDAWADRAVVLPRDLATARRAIAEQRLDVLLYTDIGMHPLTYYLAFARLAPVQCTTWGHPITSGVPSIDYYLSAAPIEPAEAQGHYTEQLVTLSRLPSFYDRTAAPAAAMSRRDLGVGDNEHLYLCPQSLFKLHPDFDVAVRGILEADAKARIVLLEGTQPRWTRLVKDRMAARLGSSTGRISFVPRVTTADFPRLLAAADVMLDPLHFGGGNTTYQALALGVPIVTMPGAFMRGRVTAGCYAQMGLDTCVARTLGDYIDIATVLATDRDARRDTSRAIAARGDLIFADRRFIDEAACFFEHAVAEARGDQRGHRAAA